MIDDIKKDASARMKKSLEALQNNFHKIRTGRAHPSILDAVMVEYYGSNMPINQPKRKNPPKGVQRSKPKRKKEVPDGTPQERKETFQTNRREALRALRHGLEPSNPVVFDIIKHNYYTPELYVFFT